MAAYFFESSALVKRYAKETGTRWVIGFFKPIAGHRVYVARITSVKAQNKIQDPAKLRRLIDLIDTETRAGLDIDVKGTIHEGLLQKNAEDTKSGAGQYFTPRPLIRAIVECVRPRPGQTVCDPAAGTGGFLLAAHDYVVNNYQLNKRQKEALRFDALRGWEIVDATARLCVMNLYLHGIGGEESPIRVGDSLAGDPGETFNDIFWLKDESLEDSANLPAPQILAQEIAENLEAALEQFNSITESLSLS